MKKNVKLGENYYLTTQEINSNVTVEVAKKTNHIFVVDVSGSMSGELPQIRTQLKNKLSNLMKEGDTISIVWFSGRNDSGILKEEVEVKSLKTLTDLHDAIDKWLRPIGLTAFLKPLQLVQGLVDRIKKNRPDSVFSMIFLTDGYNNDCPWNEVIKTLKDMESDIASSTFVEYGYYADSRAITQMASVLGGEKISCDGFDEFELVFDAKISSNILGGKKTVVEITDKYLYDFAFSVSNGSVLLYNIVDGKIMVGGDVKEIYFFSPKAIGVDVGNTVNDTSLYAAIYVLADKLLNDDAEKIFYALGDQYYYQMLVNAFGKQKLNSFKAAIKECIADASKRYPVYNGKVIIKPVPDNAYCLMNLIEDLGNIDGCLFYPNHPEFQYNRIGRKKIAASSVLTDADKQRLAEAKTFDEANKIMKELEEKKVDVKFVNTNPDRGYPMTDLVWNKERANLSIRIYIEGEVILPKNKFNIEKVSSFKYNTFTIIKDGIVNVQKLPVSYSKELEDHLNKNGVKYDVWISSEKNVGTNSYQTIVIDLSSLPLVNRGMVKAVSAKALAEQEWELLKLQANEKVYDYYKKSLFPKTSKSFVEMFGEDCANWLKEIGITDFNGFAPKTTQAESTDFYLSVNLATKIKGLSSLPKVEDVVTKIKAGKELKLNEWIMADAIKKYLAQLDSDMYKSLNEEQQKGVLKTYLETKSAILNKQRRKALQEIAQIKFSLILSKRNFVEFKSFDENKLSLVLDGQNLDFTFEFSEKQVNI
jgi:uncharacterized protein YegL